MDETYSWHKGARGVNSTWPVPVPLLPDEIISSWLARTSLGQGCDPLVLTGNLWPKWRIWTIDLDRGLSDERLFILSKASGIKVSSLKSASLFPIISKLTTKSLNNNSLWPWVLSLGSRNRRRSGGLQFCPMCLCEDRSPYFRIQWRLAWHTNCPRHTILLCDRCSFCGASVEPHRLLAKDHNLAYCATCKSDLRRNKIEKFISPSFEFQKVTDRVVINSCGSYGNIMSLASDWFELTRFFINLLRKISLGKSKSLNLFANAFGVDVNALNPPATGLPFELLPVLERAMLLKGAWSFILSGPNHFFHMAKKLSLSASSLCDRHQQYPVLLSDALKDLPIIYRPRNIRDKPSLRKPRSHLAVNRMWARLKRKHRILNNRRQVIDRQ